jgi:hypothetical protein
MNTQDGTFEKCDETLKKCEKIEKWT